MALLDFLNPRPLPPGRELPQGLIQVLLKRLAESRSMPQMPMAAPPISFQPSPFMPAEFLGSARTGQFSHPNSPIQQFFQDQQNQGRDFRITPGGNFGEFLRGALQRRLGNPL